MLEDISWIDFCQFPLFVIIACNFWKSYWQKSHIWRFHILAILFLISFFSPVGSNVLFVGKKIFVQEDIRNSDRFGIARKHVKLRQNVFIIGVSQIVATPSIQKFSSLFGYLELLISVNLDYLPILPWICSWYYVPSLHENHWFQDFERCFLGLVLIIQVALMASKHLRLFVLYFLDFHLIFHNYDFLD